MPEQSTIQLRTDLVRCTRMLAQHGILDYSGHVSARIPGTETMLIQQRDTSRAALTPQSLVTVDLAGTVIEGSGPPPAETAIHTAIYRARPEVTVVCHGHPTLSTAFTMTNQVMVPMRHFAYRLIDGLPVHADVTHIRTQEQGDALARTLGTAGVCLIRAHGTVVVGTRFDELFMDCLDLEENARTQIAAAQLGGLLQPLTAAEAQVIAASYGALGHRPAKIWEHYLHRAQTAGVI